MNINNTNVTLLINQPFKYRRQNYTIKSKILVVLPFISTFESNLINRSGKHYFKSIDLFSVSPYKFYIR